MNIELVTITPQIAQHYLSKNTANRKLVERNVLALERALKNNEWVLNGETIKFSQNGELIDGQHRLAACIRTELPFQSFIVRDLPDDSFTTIDTGAKRTASDMLSISGNVNTHITAAIVRAYVDFKINNTFGNPRISASNTQIVNEYENDKEFYDNLALSYPQISKFVNSAFMAICKYAIEIYGNDWFESSINKIKTGQNLNVGDPCLTLREWAINHKGRSQRQVFRAVYVKAIKAMATGKEVRVLRYTDDEKFPTL